MATVNCPSCRRALNLPDHVRGQPVQCPACDTTFEIPAEPLPVATRQPPTPQPLPAPPAPHDEPASPDPSGAAFDFNDEYQVAYYRVRNKVNDAASWLQRTIIFDAFAIHLCFPCFLFAFRRERWMDQTSMKIVFGGSYLFVMFLLLLIVMGAYYLRQRRAYGLALLAGILALLVALKNLATLGLIAFHMVKEYKDIDPCAILPMLPLVGCLTGAAVCGGMGGVKTIAVLHNPQVRDDFS
jgi:hypothetical protein